MKRILIFHPYLAPYRIDLYNRLSKLFEVQALLTGGVAEKRALGFDLEFVNRQAQFRYKYIDRGFYLGRHLLSLIYFKQIISFRPNSIMAHELGINTIAAILLKPFFRYKLLVTIDDSPAMIRCYKQSRKMLQRFVIKHADALLVVHPEVKNYLKDNFKNNKNCHFIYFPIIQDEELLKIKIAETESETAKLLYLHRLYCKKVILFVGRLEKVKSPDILLKAFHQINANDCILIFIGTGSLEKELRKYTSENGLENKVLFTGRLSGKELYAWYRIADVFVLPSKHEPFGAVVNEALIAGCKVIVSIQVGANCLVNSSNGKIVESLDSNSLAIAIQSQLDLTQDQPKGALRQSKMFVSFEKTSNLLAEFIAKNENHN